MLHLVHVHHEILGELVVQTSPEKLPQLLSAAADFMGEALAFSHLVQRGLTRD